MIHIKIQVWGLIIYRIDYRTGVWCTCVWCLFRIVCVIVMAIGKIDAYLCGRAGCGNQQVCVYVGTEALQNVTIATCFMLDALGR